MRGEVARRALLAALIASLTVVVFWPATGFDFVDIDDPVFVTENPRVRDGLSTGGVAWAFGSTHASNWVPLTFLSLMADTTFFGPGPRGYHTTNVLLHAANAALLFFVVLRLSGSAVAAVVATLLFALHPMRVESVAWVAERKDVLSTFFWFAATLAWLSHRGFAVALALFALGLMAKGMLVTLPVTLLLLVWVWPGLRAGRTDPPRLLPFFVLAAAGAAVTLWAQGSGTSVTGLGQLGLADRIANAVVGYATYPLRLVWPLDLAVFHPHPAFVPPHDGWSATRVLLSASGLFAATALFAVLARRGFRHGLAGWAFYLVTLLPVIGIVQVGMQATADRYTYVPHLGLIWIVVAGAAALTRGRPRARLAAIGLAGVVVIAGASLTAREIHHWRDSESLFRRALEVTGRNGVILDALGTHYARQGRTDEAITLLEDAVEAMPRFAEAHADLGIVLVAAGRPEEAEPRLRTALEVLPRHTRARVALGNLLAARGDLSGAADAWRTALEIDATLWEAEFGLGLVAQMRDRDEVARRRFERALALAPDDEARARIEAARR